MFGRRNKNGDRANGYDAVDVLEVRDLTAAEAAALAEEGAHEILGVSAEEAFAMLERGELDGTVAEAEISMLRSLVSA
jgi:hypothetical protein